MAVARVFSALLYIPFTYNRHWIMRKMGAACVRTDSAPKSITLIEDPLKTRNIFFLEEILKSAKGYRFIEDVQMPPYWTSVCAPTNTDRRPLNKYLPGGIIVRCRYSVASIREHYHRLTRR